jgi:hypothetical protein
MADTAKPGEPEPAPERTTEGRDHADRGEDPPTGGLTAVLGKLRDAAAAHDDELSDQGGLPQHG